MCSYVKDIFLLVRGPWRDSTRYFPVSRYPSAFREIAITPQDSGIYEVRQAIYIYFAVPADSRPAYTERVRVLA